MVVQKLTDEELWSNVDQSITEMIQWNARRADTMVNVSQWGDSQEREFLPPFFPPFKGQSNLMPPFTFSQSDTTFPSWSAMRLEIHLSP